MLELGVWSDFSATARACAWQPVISLIRVRSSRDRRPPRSSQPSCAAALCRKRDRTAPYTCWDLTGEDGRVWSSEQWHGWGSRRRCQPEVGVRTERKVDFFTCSRVSREGIDLSGSSSSSSSSGLPLGRGDRDALRQVLVTRLSGLGDVYLALRRGDEADAQRMWRRSERDMRLLDDLGWERETERDGFRLTMTAEELRGVLEGIYWESVAGLSQKEDDLADDAREQLKAVVGLCSSLLAQVVRSDSAAAAQRVSAAEVAALAEKVAQLAESIKKA